jgi:predicted nucleic acid-binding protein
MATAAVMVLAGGTPKWGNSLAVRLPASVVEALELKAGSNVLWTEDLQDGAVLEGVGVSNPFLAAQP